MKTDNYLTLCLEQAANSPLRYRHGCIIVRGGKVIGQGFNDVRAGFDGGALKTGRLPARSLDGATLAELKKKQKLKRDIKNLREDEEKTFTPYEKMGGGGKLANAPLSMHSEMMAIHSAVSASSTMALSTLSHQKPYFKVSSDSKRKARLRRDAIKAYVETVCKAALAQSIAEHRSGSSQVQVWRFEGTASQPGAAGARVSVQGGGGERGGASMEKYRETPNEKSEVSSSQRSQRVQRSTTLQTAPTVCT
jgi:deoxycytidylate deaminase